MVVTLLILGVTIIGVTTIWMIEHATYRGVSGWRLLVPFTAASYVRDYWEDVRFPAMARILGVVFVVVALAVAVAKNPDLLWQPSLFWHKGKLETQHGSTRAGMSQFMKTRNKALSAMQDGHNHDLSGKLHGKAFAYQRVDLINGVLTVREGRGFLPTLEVRIFINVNPTGMTERRSFYVQPTDQHPPHVYLSWMNDEGKLQTRVIKRGYSLELQLAPLTKYRLNGFMQLIVPGSKANYLSGNFVAETNHLRFVNGEVDIAYNNTDTLQYVAEQYVSGRYRDDAIQHMQSSNVAMHLDSDSGSADVTIVLSNGQIELHQVSLERHDFGWRVKSGSDTVTVLRKARKPEQKEKTTEEIARQILPPQTIAPDALNNYSGKTATIMRSNGSTDVGVIRGFDKHGLQLEEQVGAGSVQYNIESASIKSITLRNGKTLLLQNPEDGSKAANTTGEQAEPSSTSGANQTSSQEASQEKVAQTDSSTGPAGQADDKQPSNFKQYKALLNKRVIVIGKDGQRRQGRLSGVAPQQLTLTVSMGGGSMQFYYKPSDVRSITPLKN